MSEHVRRWSNELRMTHNRSVNLESAYEREAYRIALAAAKWRGRKMHFSDMGRTTHRTEELDAYVNNLINAILEGKGPGE